MPARHTLVSFFGLGSHTAAPLLYSYIAEHPQFAGTATPTHFFSEASVFVNGLSWYEEQFQQTASRTVCGELAHDYLANSQAAGLIARTYPNARLLAVIENPLISVRVDYVEALRSRVIQRKVSLDQFIANHPEYLLRARYGRQLVHYFSYYAPTDLLVLLASDIRSDLLKQVKLVYGHCGLDDTYVPLSLRHLVVEEFDENKKTGFIKRRFLAIKKIIRSVYGLFSKLVKRKAVKSETSAEIARRLPLSPALEAKLKDYFRQDVTQLSALLHRNLNVEWGFDQ